MLFVAVAQGATIVSTLGLALVLLATVPESPESAPPMMCTTVPARTFVANV
ncbi:MAG: hypothetical protein ABR964_00510 [Tepidisphaeraceae bacterium]